MGLDAVMLAELGAGTGGIEVAEGHKIEPVEFAIPLQHLLEHELGFAVGVDRPLRQRFVHGHPVRRTERRAG